MKLADCEVWIACDGKPLPEYSVTPEGDNEKHLACFVPSEAGKKFAIHFRNTGQEDTLRFRKRLDGTATGSAWYLPGESGKSWGVRVTPTSRRPYHFSPLLTTDDDSSASQHDSSELGSICIRVERVEVVPRKQPAGPYRSTPYNPVGPIHERSKKVGIHCVSLGEATTDKVGPPLLNTTRKINPDEGPVATFTFRYRPLVFLQAQGITPLSYSQRNVEPEAGPSQQSSENDHSERQRSAEEDRPAKRMRLDAEREEDDVKPDIAEASDNSDGEELDELKGQLQQILSRIERMEKKKKKARKSSDRGTVKKEEPGTSSAFGPGGDIIDLTLSD